MRINTLLNNLQWLKVNRMIKTHDFTVLSWARTFNCSQRLNFVRSQIAEFMRLGDYFFLFIGILALLVLSYGYDSQELLAEVLISSPGIKTKEFKNRESNKRSGNNLFRKWVNLASEVEPMFKFDFDDMISRKRVTSLVPALIIIAVCIGFKPTSSLVGVFYNYLRFVSKLLHHSGVPGSVKYLKACFLILQQSVSGYNPDLTVIRPRPALAGSCIPSIIPLHHRKRIRSNDLAIIKLWLSLFSIFRVMSYKGKVNLSTITDGLKVEEYLYDNQVVDLENFVPVFYKYVGIPEIFKFEWDYLSDFKWRQIDKLLGSPEPFIISKSSPFTDQTQPGLSTSTSQQTLLDSASYLRYSSIWKYFTKYLQKTSSDLAIKIDRIASKGFSERLKDGSTKKSEYWDDRMGKLGLKQEAAGKVRVFAMVDVYTQWLLRPLHRYLFSVLRKLSTDGTFDQLKPILKMIKFNYVKYYSYDLSSATDRLPVEIQVKLLSPLLGAVRAQAWADLLVKRSYAVSPVKGVVKHIKYAVGQPMGALSSWAMLAMTHHFIVQYAWYASGFRHFFEDYCILGDDIVIANKKVAKKYLQIMKNLGVEVNLSKSLVSSSGIEFAKRFFYKTWDLSPVPVKELNGLGAALSSLPTFVAKYGLDMVSTLRVVGAGYKFLSSFRDKSILRMTPKFRAAYIYLLREEGKLLHWFCRYSLLKSWQLKDSDVFDLMREYIIPLYCRAINKAMRRWVESDLTRALRAISENPLEIHLGINIILDVALSDRVKGILRDCEVLAKPEFWSYQLYKRYTVDETIDQLRSLLADAYSLPSFKGLYLREDIQKKDNRMFLQEVAIWLSVNSRLSNIGTLVKTSDWKFTSEDDPLLEGHSSVYSMIWSDIKSYFMTEYDKIGLWIWTAVIGWAIWNAEAPHERLSVEVLPTIPDVVEPKAPSSFNLGGLLVWLLIAIFSFGFCIWLTPSTDPLLQEFLLSSYRDMPAGELADALNRPKPYFETSRTVLGGISPQMASGYWEHYDVGPW